MQILCWVLVKIENKMAHIIMSMWRAMMQPHLEYFVQFWSSYLKDDMCRPGKSTRQG